MQMPALTLLKIIQQYQELTQCTDPTGELNQYQDWSYRGFSPPSPDFVKRAVLLRNRLPNATWVETGTYYGDTTFELAKIAAKIYTLEPDQMLYENAKKRFASHQNVEIINGISEEIFPTLLPKLSGDVCFWLDGHFSGGVTHKGPNDTPITVELEHIKTNLFALENIVVMVDDMRLFNGKIHSYGTYPSLNYLTDWARALNLSWHIEHDIFVAKSLGALD